MSGYSEFDSWVVGKKVEVKISDKWVKKTVKRVFLTNPIPYVPNCDERVFVVKSGKEELDFRESSEDIKAQVLREAYAVFCKEKKK